MFYTWIWSNPTFMRDKLLVRHAIASCSTPPFRCNFTGAGEGAGTVSGRWDTLEDNMMIRNVFLLIDFIGSFTEFWQFTLILIYFDECWRVMTGLTFALVLRVWPLTSTLVALGLGSKLQSKGFNLNQTINRNQVTSEAGDLPRSSGHRPWSQVTGIIWYPLSGRPCIGQAEGATPSTFTSGHGACFTGTLWYSITRNNKKHTYCKSAQTSQLIAISHCCWIFACVVGHAAAKTRMSQINKPLMENQWNYCGNSACFWLFWLYMLGIRAQQASLCPSSPPWLAAIQTCSVKRPWAILPLFRIHWYASIKRNFKYHFEKRGAFCEHCVHRTCEITRFISTCLKNN